MTELEIIGLMSGTSLDGLDVAHVQFINFGNQKEFKLLNYKTFHYESEFINELQSAPNLSIVELLKLDKKIGKEFAQCVNEFINEFQIERKNIDAIASHGQTILHQPANGFTLQIGCGSTIAFHTQLPVINDFRTMDVVAGGQGAPLVPVGDFDLFSSEADSFLNLGGFANISLKNNGKIVAFDICPANLPFNELVKNIGLNYDKDGEIARKGLVNNDLLIKLNELGYYSKSAPKSLGTEWLVKYFYPILNSYNLTIEDKLATVSEHLAHQIANVISKNNLRKVLATGGGVKNSFLIERIQSLTENALQFPEESVSDFKEAIIFAYLGALFLWDKPNCVSSVTGAKTNVIGGCLHKVAVR
jgi:anhydro-N-acetylmuramic acid kinase